MFERIPFYSLTAQHETIRQEALAAIAQVYDSNWFVLGKELEGFESAFAALSKMPYCVGVGNGLDALFIALKSCGIGPNDEVIVPAHTFLATWLAVSRTGARIVPVDADPLTGNISVQKLWHTVTANTKAIVPVHLYGQPCNMTEIMKIAGDRIVVVEDNAQSHGALWEGKTTGSFGRASATSFYPAKNLGALGDGGAVLTRDHETLLLARQYRNYGFETKNVAVVTGVNSRLDELQSAVLRVKLKYLDQWNQERRDLATVYLNALRNIGDVQLPDAPPQAFHTYHLFVIRTARRNDLRAYLAAHQIETAVHYPVPPHLQQNYIEMSFEKGAFPVSEAFAETALSLPLWPGMRKEQAAFVAETIAHFFRGS